MKTLFVRITPKAGPEKFFRCGIEFTRSWCCVDVDNATGERLHGEQMLEVTETEPEDFLADATLLDSARAETELKAAEKAQADAQALAGLLAQAETDTKAASKAREQAESDLEVAAAARAQAETDAKAVAELLAKAEANLNSAAEAQADVDAKAASAKAKK